MEKLVLFDIDGTLIDSGGAGRNALDRVFWDFFGISLAFSDILMAGKTDVQIIKEGLTAHGIAANDGVLPNVVRAYVKTLKNEINNQDRHLKPGVIKCLNALGRSDRHWTGLLTGNVRQGARVKLGAFELNAYFCLGAFGDDDEDRNRLLPIAVERFRRMTRTGLDYDDCIVIGDTPRDVECSKPKGATSIVVATGRYDSEALSQTQADYVLEDLQEAFDVIKTL